MLTDNRKSSAGRRFNVARELGRILLHNGIENLHGSSLQKFKNTIEKQANLFALHFLLPNEAFTYSLLSTSLEFYKDLKLYWKVPIQAMITKTYLLNLITKDQHLRLNKKVFRNKWQIKEPYDDEIPMENPNLMRQVYELIVGSNILSKDELNASFRLPKDEVEKIIGTNITDLHANEAKKPVLRLIK